MGRQHRLRGGSCASDRRDGDRVPSVRARRRWSGAHTVAASSCTAASRRLVGINAWTSLTAQLAAIIEGRYGPDDERCFLFPTERIAESCRAFLVSRSPSVSSRVVRFDAGDGDEPTARVFAVFTAAAHAGQTKLFWQHTGDGVSSRRAEHVLSLLAKSSPSPTAPVPLSDRTRTSSQRGWTRNRHYSKRAVPSDTAPIASADDEVEDLPSYVEERYGRNLARSYGSLAKTALRRRIAGVLSYEAPESADAIAVQSTRLEDMSLSVEEEALRAASAPRTEQSDRGVVELSEDDVYLWPTGMSAIFHAHQLLLRRCRDQGRQPGKSICFGCAAACT